MDNLFSSSTIFPFMNNENRKDVVFIVCHLQFSLIKKTS